MRNSLAAAICFLSLLVALPIAAQEISGNFQQGSVKVGYDSATCDVARNGAIRYVSGGNPPWEFCNGSAWSPFKQPRCVNDATGECYLATPRSGDDGDFTASNIKSGVNILGVTGTYSAGSGTCTSYTGPVNDFAFPTVLGAVSTQVTSAARAVLGITDTVVHACATGTGSPVIVRDDIVRDAGPLPTLDGTQLALQATAPSTMGASRTVTLTVGTAFSRNFTIVAGAGAQHWGEYTASNVPVAPSGGHFFVKVTQGASYQCGIRADSAAYCWGDNFYGQLGDGTTTTRTNPTLVSGGHSWSAIVAGSRHTCGIRTDGAAMCWGYNGDGFNGGMLGDGTQTNRTVPTLVSGSHSWSALTVGDDHTCGIRTDGAAMCWGLNISSQLGDGTTTKRLVPTLVSGGHSWTKISASFWFTCGIRTDNAAMCWGDNSTGQFGNNTTTSSSTPTLVSGSHSWSDISTGTLRPSGFAFFTCGVRTDNAGYCWGNNTNGNLGDGTTTQRLVPTLVSGGHSWSKIDANVDGSASGGGVGHACGFRTDGAAYCWGNNNYGQLGDGTTTQRTAPTAVSGGGTWYDIEAGGRNSIGLRVP